MEALHDDDAGVVVERLRTQGKFHSAPPLCPLCRTDGMLATLFGALFATILFATMFQVGLRGVYLIVCRIVCRGLSSLYPTAGRLMAYNVFVVL